MMDSKEKTLLVIKPDATKRNLTGEILKRVEERGFKILELKTARLSKSEAQAFYYIHVGKPFLKQLVNFISSGKIVACLLERENAIAELRNLIGATDPQKAEPGTIRRDLGVSLTENSVHASDSASSAKFEINFFFKKEKS